MDVTRPYPQEAQGSALARKAHVPLPVLFMLIAVIMVPIEFNISAGGLMLTPAKIYLLGMAFVIMPRLAQMKMQIFDWAVIAHGLWTATAIFLAYGLGAAQSAGLYVLEFIVVYLIARVYLTNLAQLKATIGLLFLLVVISTIAAIPEGLSGRRYIHEFGRSLTGYRYTYDAEYRMGLLRSASFFEHPILFGLFCSATMSLVWFTSTVGQRLWKVPMIFLGAFFAASSAPLLALVLQCWLILIERVSRKVKNRVTIFTSIAVVLGSILEMTTGRGMIGTIAMVTLNPGTTYIRRVQWQFAIDDVMAHSIFGFDTYTWTRPTWLVASIDNNWLLMMMKSGIPGFAFLILGLFFIWRTLSQRGTDVPELFSQMRKGWGLMIIAVLFTGATVAFFGKLQPLLSFYIGFGAALASVAFPQRTAAGETPAEPTREIRYTRFAKGGHAPAEAPQAPRPAEPKYAR